MTAGILLVVLPSVMYGGLSLLMLLTARATGIVDNPLRHDLWRVGHAHAGVYLVLSLVMLLYVDQAVLPPFWKWLARTGAPIAAILIPAAFFLSVVSPTATQPNGLMNLAYVGAVFFWKNVLVKVYNNIKYCYYIYNQTTFSSALNKTCNDFIIV